MRKLKLGDKIKTDSTDEEGIVIALDDRDDEFAKVKVRFYDIVFRGTEWFFESSLNKIIE
jgi:hypothetical protein